MRKTDPEEPTEMAAMKFLPFLLGPFRDMGLEGKTLPINRQLYLLPYHCHCLKDVLDRSLELQLKCA